MNELLLFGSPSSKGQRSADHSLFTWPNVKHAAFGSSSSKIRSNFWIGARDQQDAEKMKTGGTWLVMPANCQACCLRDPDIFSNEWRNMMDLRKPRCLFSLWGSALPAYVIFTWIWLDSLCSMAKNKIVHYKHLGELKETSCSSQI